MSKTKKPARSDAGVIQIAYFIFSHVGEEIKHVFMRMPDGTMNWAYVIEADPVTRRRMLAYGEVSMATFFDGEDEFQAHKLHKSGERVCFYDDEDLAPTATLLRDAFLTIDVAPELDLFIWEDDTTIYHAYGTPEYELLGNDRRSKSVRWVGYAYM